MLGFGMGGEWACGAVLVTETWPAAHRGKAISIMQSGWALGYMLAALVAGLVLPTLGWRWLFVVGAAPALLVAFIRRGVGESEVWLANSANPPKQNSLIRILRPPLLNRAITPTLLVALLMFAYWGVFGWLPAFLSSPVNEGGAGLNIIKSTAWIITMQFGAFLGFLTFGFFADRFGRRRTFIIYLICAAVLTPVYGSMARSEGMLMALGPFLGFFGSGYMSLFGVMLSELFPTTVRVTAQAFCFSMGRALGAFAPYVIGTIAAKQGIGHALALNSAFFIAAAILVFRIPETQGKSLENDIV